MIEDITSLQNEKVKIWRSLNKDRAERMSRGLFLAEGEHMVGEALRENAAVALLIDSEKENKYAALLALAADLPMYRLSARVMAAIADAKTPQGVIAICRYPENAALAALGARVVTLDGVQDPGNVGTILRTMDAAAFTGLLINPATADPFGAKAVRATMGGVFRVPVRLSPDLASDLSCLRENSYQVLAGDLRGEDFSSHPPFSASICLIVGSEGAGISPGILALADRRLRLPMPGRAESLNAAVAAGIMMYEVIRG